MASWGRRRAELGSRGGKAMGDGPDQELGQAAPLVAGEESKGAEGPVDPRFWLVLGVAYTALGARGAPGAGRVCLLRRSARGVGRAVRSEAAP